MSGAGGRRRAALSCGWVFLGLLALMGCREEEQGRPVILDDSAYRGEPDDVMALGDDTVQALNERALTQQF